MVSTKNRLFWLIPIIAVLIALIAGFALLGGGSGDKGWQKQYDLGMRYLTDMDYEAALAAFTAAIEIDPNQGYAFLGRAQAHTAAGDDGAAYADYEKAVAAFTAMIQANPVQASAYLGRGQAYEALGNESAALADYQQAASLGDADADLLLRLVTLSTRPGLLPPAALRGWLDQLAKLTPDVCEVHETGYHLVDADGSIYADFYFDDTGRLHDSNLYLERVHGSFREEEYTYHWEDENGQAIRTEEYDTDGTCTRITIYKEFDSVTGRESLEELYDGNGTLTAIHRIERDGSGNTTAQIWYRPDGTLHHDLLYDGQGNLYRSNSYDAAGILERYHISEYDTEGNELLQRYYDGNGRITLLVEFTDFGRRDTLYDESGNVESVTDYDHSGNPING